MEQYSKNLAPISDRFDNDIVAGVIEKFKNKVEKIIGNENIYYEYFEHLLVQIKFADGDDKSAREFAKKAYEKIATASHVEFLKPVMSAGHYSMALFHAMDLPTDTDDFFKLQLPIFLSLRLSGVDDRQIF